MLMTVLLGFVLLSTETYACLCSYRNEMHFINGKIVMSGPSSNNWDCRNKNHLDFVLRIQIIRGLSGTYQDEYGHDWTSSKYFFKILDKFWVSENFSSLKITPSSFYLDQELDSSCFIQIKGGKYVVRGTLKNGRMVIGDFCEYGRPWDTLKKQQQTYLLENGCY